MTYRRLQVVVVAYGQPAMLESTLNALGGAFDVHVVDNSSSPEVRGVAERCRARYTDPGRNAGFGAGVNVGLVDVLGGEPADVLLLNPDAVIDAAGVRRLSQVLHESGAQRVGAVSPSLVGPDGASQRVMWSFPHPLRAWLEAIGLGRFNRAEQFAVGTVLMLRWETIREVGLFDERFFLYAEETDWQRRAARLDWQIWSLPEVVVRHIGGGTSTDSLLRERLFHAGTETYVRKWFGPSGWQLYRAAAWVGASARGLALPGARGTAARERARIFRDGPCRAARPGGR